MKMSDLSLDMRQSGRDIILNGFIASPFVPRVLRWRLMFLIGMRVRRVAINPKVWFGSREVEIGEGTFINYFCKFDGPVSVGRECNIGYDALFCTGTHQISLSGSRRRAGPYVCAPISIGDGVWIGARAVIMPGIAIGDGCVIGAGSIVTHDCEPNGMYRGVPARRVGELARK